MDALLAIQLETLMLFSLVITAFLLRLVLVQLAISLHYKARYEHQLSDVMDKYQAMTITVYSYNREPTVISPAQSAFPYFSANFATT